MVIDKKTRDEWRELAKQGMHSALGEYTPVDEFVALLDYIDELEAQLTMRAADLAVCACETPVFLEGWKICGRCSLALPPRR